MKSPARTIEHHPECPSCGYDLTGQIASWTQQCPLNGVCPECGHAYQWREVFAILNEWGSRVDWYSEHGGDWIELFQRAPGTLWRLMRPGRFFKAINHRRMIRLRMLFWWMLVVTAGLHLCISPVGAAGNAKEGYWSSTGHGWDAQWTQSTKDTVANTASAVLFPYATVYHRDDGFTLRLPFYNEDWAAYSMAAVIGIGVMIAWATLMTGVLLVQHDESRDWRRQWGLLRRVALLSLVPMLVYVEFVRLGFGIHAATGMTSATDWVPYGFLGVYLLMLFWQQAIWTHAVRSIWNIKRSFLINIGACFSSIIFGIVFLIWVL